MARDCVGTCPRGLDWPEAKKESITQKKKKKKKKKIKKKKRITKKKKKKKKKIVKIIEKMCVCLHDTFLECFFLDFFG